MRIDELMTSPATTVWPWASIPDAGRLLLRRGVTALMVVDRDGHVLGVVSRSDLLRGRLVRDPTAHLAPVPVDRTEPPHTVAGVMTTDVVALPPTADEADAAEVMLGRRIRSIPVVDEGRLLGVVSVTDLLRAAVRGDERIAADVRERLREFAGQGDAWQVRVEDGVVTIGGTVSPEEHQMLHLLAETVPGVVRVRYEDDVPAPATTAEPEATVTAAATTTATATVTAPPTVRKGPTDRRGLGVLDVDECLRRLRSVPVGRLAFVESGVPIVLPVNHGVDGMSIVFRTTWGSKLEAAKAAGAAAFEVDGFDATTRTGWSVLVRGVLAPVYEAGDISRYEALDVPAWAGRDDDTVWVVLRPDEISGREIRARQQARQDQRPPVER
jgi:CBS domain-containing protein